jgi:predicted Zn-dependent peptidase
MKKRIGLYLVWVFFVSGTGFAFERPAVERFVLDNGMTFLLLPRPSPSISFEVRVKAGSVDEPQGKTGLTHMLEHMMFKGTPSIGTTDYAKEQSILDAMDTVMRALQAAPPEERERLAAEFKELAQRAAQYQVPGEFDKIYARAGGIDMNASTSPDLTSYHVTLPRGRLEFWAVMESLRMKTPVFREFYAERDVVLKERAERVDSSDKGSLYEQFLLHAFAVNPYRTPVIGFQEDVSRLTRADLMEYYQAYYQPRNTIIAIVGGFDPLEAQRVLTQYFGDIPPRAIRENRSLQTNPSRSQVRISMASKEEPFLLMGFHKPKLPTLDDTCFDVIEDVLTGGNSTRLVRALVTQGIASSVETYNGYPGSRFDNLFVLSAAPLKGHKPKELEDVIWREIDRIKQDGMSERELARAIRSVKKSILQSLETDAGAAGLLSYYEALAGDYNYIYANLSAMEKITTSQVRECARKYLNPENAIIASLGA